MLTTPESFRLVVSLAAVHDGEIFEQVAAQHPDEIPASHRLAFREIAMELQHLINDCEFIDSPAFLSSIQGKSKQVAEMMQRIACDPVHLKEHQRRFVEALYQLPENHSAFNLVAERHHEVLHKALAAIAAANSGVAD